MISSLRFSPSKSRLPRALQNYIRTYLLEDSTTSPTSSIKDNLNWLQVGDTFLVELGWFQENWPDDIHMRFEKLRFKRTRDVGGVEGVRGGKRVCVAFDQRQT